MELVKIAHIECDFSEKFGIPRQSGLVKTKARIVFEKEYANPDAVRGLEGYSHLWLLWHFSKMEKEGFVPTVRPPRLGGNKRMGVFATRSPNRPNPIGLSSVELCGIEIKNGSPVLHIAGADLLDGTPIFDIKPYLPFTDSHPDARGGFADEVKEHSQRVEIPEDVARGVNGESLLLIKELLSQDIRPSYQNDEDRVYGFTFGKYDVKFKSHDGVTSVIAIAIKDEP